MTPDTLVVAAGAAWGYYQRHAAYVCQAGRSFKDTDRLAFYRHKRIERLLPGIVARRDYVSFTLDQARSLRTTGDPMDARVAEIIENSLQEGSRRDGVPHQVFVLSRPDDDETLVLNAAVTHQGASAWTMKHRYAASDRLVFARTTADLVTSGGDSTRVPSYVERRIRTRKPEGCSVLPESTTVVAFGDPSSARVATLGLNPSRIEFEVDGRELDGAQRRFETLGSLGVDSLEDVEAEAVERVWDRCNDYFAGNPYRRWFDELELVLNTVGTSYYDGSACHLDLSQWATDPTWNKLGTGIRQRLIDEGASFLSDQLREEPIQLLLLNGRAVINGFVRALDAQLRG